MPAIFVGHGNPLNAITDGEDQRAWRDLAARLPRPRAILAISAHWPTRGVRVTSSPRPETIHDFQGFPRALFEVTYPAPGDPALARRVVDLVATVPVQFDDERGLDHGVWSVLSVLLPAADVPVVQLSLDVTKPGSFHYGVGKQLATLRDEGVLILASGNIVHNLDVYQPGAPPADWAVRFDAAVHQRLREREHATLIAYELLGDDVTLSVPTPEHYLPLLYVIATQRPREDVGFFNERIESGIAMTSVAIGMPPQERA